MNKTVASLVHVTELRARRFYFEIPNFDNAGFLYRRCIVSFRGKLVSLISLRKTDILKVSFKEFNVSQKSVKKCGREVELYLLTKRE